MVSSEAHSLQLAAPELAPAVVLPRLAGENFPVASRLLPRSLREDLIAAYGAARLIDEAGDAVALDRNALLDAVEVDLRAAERGEASHPLLQRLTPLFSRRGLGAEPFLRLVEANRWDQRAPDLESWDELLSYCALSAQPVGEVVLAIFGQRDPSRVADANPVCSALQVLEHCQDVAEDARAGRIYLPREDRAQCGCRDADLVAAPAPQALRATLDRLVRRARILLAHGHPLLAQLSGLARPMVAGYVAGGLATADALERAGFDPNTRLVKPARSTTFRHWVRLLIGGAA
jgi:squalene synthase HpnC